MQLGGKKKNVDELPPLDHSTIEYDTFAKVRYFIALVWWFGCVCGDVLCGNGSAGVVQGTLCQYVPELEYPSTFIHTSS